MKKDLVLLIVGVAIVGIVCYAIAVLRPKSPTSLMAGTGTSSATTSGGADLDKAVAHVNGEAITQGEFDVAYAAVPPEQQTQLGPHAKGVITEQLVKMKLLAQEAKRKGWDKDPQVVAQLRLGETDTLVKAAITKMQQAPGDEAALRAEYERNKAAYTTLSVRHILIAYQGGKAPAKSGKAPSIEEAQAKANAAYDQLQKGADFAKVARQFSDDVQSAERGGMLGNVRKGMLPPEIEFAVLGLDKGQISKPVRSEFGFHIFQAVDKKEAPFEEVKAQIGAASAGEKIKQTVEGLQKSSKVDYEPGFAPPAPPPAGTQATPLPAAPAIQ